jgi:IS30 family transposase
MKGTSANIRIPNRVPIQKRPGIVAARKRFGDWEADTMKGTMTGSAVNVVGDRRSRFALLKKIPDMTASATRDALIKNLKPLPRMMRRTMTFDNGTENVEHEKVSRTLGLNTFFCDSYASWQKGFIENLIGLIRQYLPKGQSLATLTSRQLQRIQDRLNHRPRKSLNFLTPHEVLSNHLKRLGVQLPA